MNKPSVYITTNQRNTTLYIGVINYLERRIYEHKNKLTKDFNAKYNLDKLVYFEQFDDIRHAIEREKRLKKWNRAWKEQLIQNLTLLGMTFICI